MQNTDNFSQRRSYPSAFPPRSTQHHAHVKTRAARRPQRSAPDVPRRVRPLGRARARAHLVIWDLVRNGLHRRQRNLPSRCFDARRLPPATALVGRCAAAMPAVIWPGVGGDGRSRGRCSDYPHHANIVNFTALCRTGTEEPELVSIYDCFSYYHGHNDATAMTTTTTIVIVTSSPPPPRR